ncbi:MAG: protein translocase subunit SecF [Gammaproteobacteria bacterium]|nr:protein translocase subunit SecF [Gammaproteobacteria bacterium]
MEIFKVNSTFDFMGKRKLAMVLSIIVTLICLGSILFRGFNLGIDFTGGTLLEVAYPDGADLNAVRTALAGDFTDAQVQHFGSASDVLIRMAPRPEESSAALSERVLQALRQDTPAVEMRRVEFVGPQVGQELIEKGGLAITFALIGILIYVALRFEYRFAVGAIVATLHDVIVTVGIFSLFRLEFDLTILAAVLAVIGYSLNDTIVVFDRIRENFRRIRKGSPLEIMNIAINETLSRTIMTSATTLLVVLAMLYFGGKVIHGFSLALVIGIVVGTYSSIFMASATVLGLGLSKSDLLPVAKEGAERNERP